MNNMLELKGKRFVQAAKKPGSNGASMNSKAFVTSEQLLRLEAKLQQIKEFWEQESKPFSGILISVHYNKIVAKSNRIAGLFKGKDSNLAIVGAKFNKEKNKHIITYFLDSYDLDMTINSLLIANEIIRSLFKDGITQTVFDKNKALFDKINAKTHHMSKSAFRQIIADVSYIEDFEIERATQQFKESIITLYDTKMDTQLLFKNIGIDILSSRILDNRTVFLDENQAKILYEKAPYLVAMATENLLDLSPEVFMGSYDDGMVHIPSPSIEPTIGVIDTLFDGRNLNKINNLHYIHSVELAEHELRHKQKLLVCCSVFIPVCLSLLTMFMITALKKRKKEKLWQKKDNISRIECEI